MISKREAGKASVSKANISMAYVDQVCSPVLL